jgi:serine/threonine protein kinase
LRSIPTFHFFFLSIFLNFSSFFPSFVVIVVGFLQMLEGQPPYFKLTTAKALFLISTQGAPPLKTPNKWSKDLQHMLGLCLAKEPSERASSIELLRVSVSLLFFVRFAEI